MKYVVEFRDADMTRSLVQEIDQLSDGRPLKLMAMQTLLAIECSSHVNAVAYIADIDRPDEWLGEISRNDVQASAWLLPEIGRVAPPIPIET